MKWPTAKDCFVGDKDGHCIGWWVIKNCNYPIDASDSKVHCMRISNCNYKRTRSWKGGGFCQTKRIILCWEPWNGYCGPPGELKITLEKSVQDIHILAFPNTFGSAKVESDKTRAWAEFGNALWHAINLMLNLEMHSNCYPSQNKKNFCGINLHPTPKQFTLIESPDETISVVYFFCTEEEILVWFRCSP